ncbi:hypothetical protein PGT21_015570 [Puccinia graminis f. sp. tritici]|uniref:Uncharacterized protein n=1 Tax=Puccinia graminis f. sp. tritici TaxID=56615 RepID=A0A5B0NGD9_PUCGR|nr:hypothetical protein PGT21_015570 [Puccinia graminis f. sp. tritici]
MRLDEDSPIDAAINPLRTLVKWALINALPPPPRTPTPTPLQKGRAIEPAPPGGAGLIARPSEA